MDLRNIKTRFREYISIETNEERTNFIFRYPGLMSGNGLNALISHYQQHGTLDQVVLYLRELDGARLHFFDHIQQYPIGIGPLENLVIQHLEGKISYDALIGKVTDPDFQWNLSPVYIWGLSTWAKNEFKDNDADFPFMLVRIATESCVYFCDNKVLDDATQYAVYAWLYIASVRFSRYPVSSVFHSSRQIGLFALNVAIKSNDEEQISTLLHLLGNLHSTPWSAGKNALDYENEFMNWKLSINAVMAAHEIEVMWRDYPIPTAAEAFDTAIDFYKRSLQYDIDKGEKLKGLLQCLMFKNVALGFEIDLEDVKRLCKEAISNLEPGNFNRNTVLSIAKFYQIELGTEEFDEEIKIQLPEQSPNIILEEIKGLATSNPKLALKRLLEEHKKGEGRDQEDHYISRINMLGSLISSAYNVNGLFIEKENFEFTLSELLRSNPQNDEEKEKLAAAFFECSRVSVITDNELKGLEVLHSIKKQSARFYQKFNDVILFQEGSLNSNVAVNYLNTGEMGLCLKYYVKALDVFQRLHLQRKASNYLFRIADVCQGPLSPPQIELFLKSISPIVYDTERILGETGMILFQRIMSSLFKNFTAENVDLKNVILTYQLSKSLRFSNQLNSRQKFNWREDEFAIEIIEELKTYEPYKTYYKGLNETLLVSHSNDKKPTAGDTNEEKIINAQQVLDQYLSRRPLDPKRKFKFFKRKDIQHHLEKNTVLLDYFFAEMDEQKDGLFILLHTTEDSTLFINEIGDKNLESNPNKLTIEDYGIQLRKPIADRVKKIRKVIQLSPGSGILHRAAKEQLAEDFDVILGTDLWEQLLQYNQSGFDQLCIIPHGALRYYPFSMLGYGGTILGDLWSIRILPTLDYLKNHTNESAPKKVSALGISYAADNPFGLSELPNAEDEAAQIARIYDVQPLLGNDVTETKFKQVIRRSSCIHISSHGQHDANVPMFQCLFFNPDAENDGRLYAYELLDLDLEHVKLFTLSACETALGRFDIGDNISGLPASLFLSGVSTIIATLWNVSDQATKVFFTSFHKSFKDNENKLLSFKLAQEKTRKTFPEARDWAAFQYLGAE